MATGFWNRILRVEQRNAKTAFLLCNTLRFGLLLLSQLAPGAFVHGLVPA